MDEYRVWKRSRRKRRLRLLAVTLVFCLLFTTYPNISETLSVFAAGIQSGDGIVYVAGFAGLPEEVREQTVPVETGVEELTLPDTQESHTVAMPEYQAETVTIEGITWQSEPEFDGNTEGIYIFTAVLPEGYALMEGVGLPQITVTVQADSADSVIQALLDRIAALPDSEAYLAKEPDTEEEEAYAEWMEGLYQYAGEALDIQEAYEALTEEQQAQIPTEAQDKLAAWVQTVMQIAENDRVMLAVVDPTPGVISSDQEWSGCLSAGTYTIQPGVTVTVTDTLLIEGNVNVTINGGGTLKRGFTTGTENGSIIKVGYGGGLILDNVIIDGNNMSAQGPAVYIGDGTVTMQNGSVIQNNYNANTGNNGDQAGGGIYCEGTLQIDGGTIKNCSTYDDQMTSGRTYAHAGGAIYLKGTCTMTAGSITGNTANNGGGIYLASTGAELNLKGGTIAGNSVRTNGNGAGIYYSTVNGVTSTLVIGGDADVQDVIYLDITSGTKYPYITSSLRHKITLACSEGGKNGRVLLGGDGYQLTIEDARMVSMQNTNLYSRLNSLENKIYLSTVPCGHEDIQKVSAKGATCLAAGNKEYYICPVCGNLFSDSTGSTPTTLKDVTITQKSHSYTYTASGAVITEKCGNGCGHTATATLTLKDGADLTYTGNAITPLKVERSDNWAGSQPAIAYSANINVGIVSAKITYRGAMAKTTFTIVPKPLTAGMITLASGSYSYTGREIKPAVTVKDGVNTLTSGTDYTVSYENNVNVGTSAEVTVTGKGNYTGTIEKTFEITAVDISGATVTLSSTTLTYNGSAQTIDVTSVKIGSTTLTEGTDFTVSGNTGTDAGTYTITITGKGSYGSTKEVTYTIAPKSLTADMVSIASGPYYYNGSGITPAVTVKDGGTTLVSGTDYTVSYENNVNVGNSATVTVEGKGNYTETLGETFTIAYRQLPPESLTNYVTIRPEPTNGWYGFDITLTPKDGCEVGETPAGTGNSAVTISQETGTGAKIIYIKDADGNIYEAEFTYKLDKTPPKVDLTGMIVENGTINLLNWIIGKKSMIIKIPVAGVTDALSGVEEVTYTAQPDNGTAQSGTPKEQDGYYQIALNEQFSGTIQLTVKDNAGNTANVSLTADSGKVIAEDYPPVVTLALTDDTLTPNAGGWYNTAVTIKVTVTDNKDSGSADILSGGIAEISWKDGESGTVQTVTGLPGNAPVYDKEFTISVNTDGTHTYYVNAVDNAGNKSGWQTVTVKVDTGNPVFSENLTVKNLTKEGADITFIPSEGGKVYYIVSDTGAAPTAQEVKEQSGGKGGVQDIAGGTEGSFTITGLSAGEKHTVYVVLEDAAGNLSEVRTESFLTLQKAPNITPEQVIVDYIHETITLSGIGTVEVYTDPQNPENSKITPNAEDGSLPVTPGTAVYIRYPKKTENGMTVPASDKTTIQIPDRPDKPAAKQVTVTDTTAAVTNPVSGEEYTLVEKEQTPDWTDENYVNTTGQFTGLDPNKEYDLYVRKKATGSSFASDPVKTEIRTNVTIKEPVITGDGADKSGNTAPKPDTLNADGTVTFTGAYIEEYTPVISIGSQEYTPEMTWDENSGKGSWEYTYRIPGDAAEVESTVEFRKRTLTGIEVEPDALTIYADDASNESLDTLTAYVKANSSAWAVYDNKTSRAVQAAYATTDSFAQKGAAYTYIASAEGKTDDITLTVSPVSASVTAPDKYMQVQKSDGYTAAEVAAWLPPQVTVTYTKDGYTARTENRTVTWNTASIGSGFGAATGEKTITGTVDLPLWATGGNSVSMVIEFVDKIVLRDDQMQLTVPDFSYGAQTLPDSKGSITITDTNPTYTYLYSTDGGATWVTADKLPKSDGGYIIPGKYMVKMTYTGERYMGEKTASFTVEKNALTVLPGTLAVEDKKYDKTTNASLKEGGQPALSGVAAGDNVTLGGSLSAAFEEAGPKKNIPVTVTGFLLEGEDAGYYELKNTTLTLYATISGEEDSDSDDDDDNDNGSTPEDNNGSGTPAVIPTPVTPPSDTPQPTPGANTNPGKNGGTQPTPEPTEKPEQVVIDSDKLTITGETVTTGNITETSETTTILKSGDGAVIVTVVCEDEQYTAGVSDTVAVANAVLTPEQIKLVNGGKTIEIRVDVKDISETVSGQDKEIIESGFAEYRKEMPGLTLGMYVDISMFVRVGEGGWDAVTHTKEPIEVVIGIPKELKGDGREFSIIRSHDGEYTLLPDTDDNPDTITVSTDMFSAYALVYEQADKEKVPAPGESSTKCGLCHICPTFLGICCFIWLAVLLAVFLIIGTVIWRKRKEEVN